MRCPKAKHSDVKQVKISLRDSFRTSGPTFSADFGRSYGVAGFTVLVVN